MNVDNLQHIALLIDADNTQLKKIEAVLQEVSKHGRIVVKRAYGNWKKENLKNWEGEIKRLAIKAEQQFDYTSGKNATDMALMIDAMDLLHKNIYDGFAIVSSDSDYTPLAIALREAGIIVVGIGEQKTPEAFKNSCDEFIVLENIGNEQSIKSKNNETKTKKDDKQQKDQIEEIHHLLKMAWSTYQEDNGFAFISNAGFYIKRIKPDFDSRSYGFYKLTELIESFPEKYETKPGPTESIKVYKCLT